MFIFVNKKTVNCKCFDMSFYLFSPLVKIRLYSTLFFLPTLILMQFGTIQQTFLKWGRPRFLEKDQLLTIKWDRAIMPFAQNYKFWLEFEGVYILVFRTQGLLNLRFLTFKIVDFISFSFHTWEIWDSRFAWNMVQVLPTLAHRI